MSEGKELIDKLWDKYRSNSGKGLGVHFNSFTRFKELINDAQRDLKLRELDFLKKLKVTIDESGVLYIPYLDIRINKIEKELNP